MRRIQLPRVGAAEAWRIALRGLVAAGIAPEKVVWSREGETAGQADLFAVAEDAAPPVPDGPPLLLGREAGSVIISALSHKDPERFALAHDAVYRLSRRQGNWADPADRVFWRLKDMAKSVRRDIHKTHAFVRFREITAPGANRRRFAAWFEPEHFSIEASTPFFQRRFGDMDWCVATPDLTAVCEAGELTFHPTIDRNAPPADATEALWATYYAHIFNPARIKIGAMQSEMPRKYWKNMPETALIPEMLQEAPAREEAMIALSAEAARPAGMTPRLAAIARARAVSAVDAAPTQSLAACTRCELHLTATQAVAGEGPPDARLMLVGEQPGDREDLEGRPFVGPAGQVLDRAILRAGLAREKLYLTNAVKHFHHRPQGRRRLHQTPTNDHIEHCRWWLDLERARLQPAVIVALGQTAWQALMPSVPFFQGQMGLGQDGAVILATWHPAYALRSGDNGHEVEAAICQSLRIAGQKAGLLGADVLKDNLLKRSR